MKPGTKIALGILTAATVASYIPIYDFFIKDKIDSVEVVVVKAGERIEKNEQITKSKLAIERRRKQDLLGDVIYPDEMHKIVGEDASQVIVSNSMISREMIDFDDLIPDETQGEAIRPIPSDWIYATPGSLRRKDRIDIYLISNHYVEKEQTSENSNVVSSAEPKVEKAFLQEPLLKNVRVVYAKDSSNREVTNDTESTKSKSERLNATGNISDLEIILNEEDFQKLVKEVIQNEKKLYITYN